MESPPHPIATPGACAARATSEQREAQPHRLVDGAHYAAAREKERQCSPLSDAALRGEDVHVSTSVSSRDTASAAASYPPSAECLSSSPSAYTLASESVRNSVCVYGKDWRGARKGKGLCEANARPVLRRSRVPMVALYAANVRFLTVRTCECSSSGTSHLPSTRLCAGAAMPRTCVQTQRRSSRNVKNGQEERGR